MGTAGGVPEVSRYARVRGTRRSRATRRRSRRPSNRHSARRAARTNRSLRLAIAASVAPTEGLRAWRRSEARIRKPEHDAVEFNPPDDGLDRLAMPVRREEIDPRSRAFRESLREVDFGPAGTQVDQWKSQQVALARFKDDGPPAKLARMAPQLRRPPSCRLSFSRLDREHGDGGYSRPRASHRASDKSEDPRELSGRAIFALSTGLPTMGRAMLDQPARHVTSRKERKKLQLGGTDRLARPGL